MESGTDVKLSSPPPRPKLADVMSEMSWHASSARRFSIAMAHQLGMPPTDLECLSLLAAEGPSPPTRLAEQLGLTTGAVTKMLDRLQRDGYITRSADPHDRRRLVVAAEPGRLAEHARRYEGMGERMAAVVAKYTDAELDAILDFMRAGRQAADDEIMLMREQGYRHAVRRPRRRGAPA